MEIVELRCIGQCYRNSLFLFSERTVTENLFSVQFLFPVVFTARCGSVQLGAAQNYGLCFDRQQYPYGRAGCEKALIGGRTQYL